MAVLLKGNLPFHEAILADLFIFFRRLRKANISREKVMALMIQ